MNRFIAITAAAAAAAVCALAIAGVPAAALAGDDARGEQLYDLCAQCHGADGAGMELFLAPAIAGLDQWYVEAQLKNFKSGRRGLNPDDLGGLRMYPMSQWLEKDEDVTAVAAYVSSMPRTTPTPTLEGGDPEKGKAAFALCATCHGPDGLGLQNMNGPPLAGASDWYLLTSLKKFKAGTRGGNSKNPNAALMRGMSMNIANEEAMLDLIAYIRTLQK